MAILMQLIFIDATAKRKHYRLYTLYALAWKPVIERREERREMADLPS